MGGQAVTVEAIIYLLLVQTEGFNHIPAAIQIDIRGVCRAGKGGRRQLR